MKAMFFKTIMLHACIISLLIHKTGLAAPGKHRLKAVNTAILH